jgi:protoporphyrin/coproporphyrin ferrochelatase
MEMSGVYDAFVLVSFGGPEGPDDVLPFLRNVTAGRGVPEERLAEVAEHYLRFGGVSPINAQCRALLEAVRERFAADGPDLPLYWGNRNWHPYLGETVRLMRADGVRRALVLTTSATASYSSCRQYREDLAATGAIPELVKLRHYFDHPGFVEAHADGVRAVDIPGARLVFTAHSIPLAMNDASGPSGGLYLAQQRETARLVAETVRGPGAEFDLVWQSRSGPPSVPWLEPDINEHLRALASRDVPSVVLSPTGFVSDHMEVVWDLDAEARATATDLGLQFARAATPGTHPAFVAMVRELVLEETAGAPRRSVGRLGICGLDCPNGCCRS